VFISCHSADVPWVARLKAALRRRGISVWLDRDEIRPGDLFVDALERRINQSGAVALVVSAESMRSGRVREEYARAMTLSAGGSMRLIPILLHDAPLPGFLASRRGGDWMCGSRVAGEAESVSPTNGPRV
jgi:hypothetical protein